jgi:hypothetical protein
LSPPRWWVLHSSPSPSRVPHLQTLSRRIIAACLFVLGSVIHLLATLAMGALVRVENRLPGLARWLIFGAWLQLIATITLLVGVVIFSNADSLSSVSTGAILQLIAFVLWAHSALIAFGVAHVVSTVVTWMPD